MFSTMLDSPIGGMWLTFDERYLQKVMFTSFLADEPLAASLNTGKRRENRIEKKEIELARLLCNELEAYFSGSLQTFSIPFTFSDSATRFQKQVWEVVAAIPYGEVMSYKEIADQIGNPTSYRAVANACGANELPVVVPCHRVVGTSAKGGYTLGGYSGGLDKKQWLMELEGILI